ncbi:MAG: GlsB/YeaQ/YmgE family stress response membrane protein [Patescibacteria group bacterium]
MKTNSEQGVGLNIIVGIVGAVIGGWLLSSLGQNNITGFNIQSFVVAVLGAMVLIVIVKALRRV